MIDVEPIILGELQQLAPLESVERCWQDVLHRGQREDGHATRRRQGWAQTPSRGRQVRRSALIAAVALLVSSVPAVAFSAGVRSVLGFGSRPLPNYARAQLMASTPMPGGRVAHLWTSPSTQGGQCLFVTYDRATSRAKPSSLNGGGGCSFGKQPLRGKLSWSFSMGSASTPTVMDGAAALSLHPARIELRWHGGSLTLPSRRGYFIGVAPQLANPPFRQLPYDIAVLNAAGQLTYRARIPTSFLYRDWKKVQPRLRVYRVTHGCSSKRIWNCKSR